MYRFWAIAALCALAACGGNDDEPGAEGSEEEAVAPPFTLSRVSFGDLPGWATAEPARAYDAFALSCAKILLRAETAPANGAERFEHERVATLSGAAGDWRRPCAVATSAEGIGDPAARAFFEEHFVPVEISAQDTLFTGYFEPTYEARLGPEPPYTAPVLGVPDDLVTADLSAFSDDFAGRSIVGRLEGDRFVPYADAAQISDAPPRADVLAYADPNDLLFLQIQGSGRLAFPDGSVLRAGYAGKNGRAYVPVGRTLVRDGAMELHDVSMQSIRAWLADAPAEEAARVRHSNPSYVFFRPLDLPDPQGGPIGAQGVQLTDGVSLAVDRRFHAMGLPVWLMTQETDDNPSIARLFIAQDTGGAIRGPVRGDVFFGAGEEAADLAGTMNAPGRMVMLLPRAVAAKVFDDAA